MPNLDTAIRRGIRYLESAQLPNGEFKMYFSSDPQMRQECYPDSSLFGTAMIVYALGCLPDTPTPQIVKRALAFLRAAREKPGVWRYWTRANPYYDRIVPDLDDTCLISFLLSKYGIPPNTNRTLILQNRNREGCFYTWLLMRGSTVPHDLTYWRTVLPHFITFRARTYRWLWGMTEAKPDDIGAGVNANVLLYLGQTSETEPVVAFLTNTIQQRNEATSDAYYRDPVTIYYLITRAYMNGIEGLEVVKDQIAARILEAWSNEGLRENSLQTALAISALLNTGSRPDILSSASTHLLDAQSADGSWAASPMWWGGPKRLRAFGSPELTTAMCIEALMRYNQSSGHPATTNNV